METFNFLCVQIVHILAAAIPVPVNNLCQQTAQRAQMDEDDVLTLNTPTCNCNADYIRFSEQISIVANIALLMMMIMMW